MAKIKAFGALRFTPKAGKLEDLVCPPYDIISEEERTTLLDRNQHNLIRLELPREGRDPYEEASLTLQDWLANAVLQEDEAPGLYLYEETFRALGETKSIVGLCCMVRLEEFEKGVVLPHEQTLSKAKTDRFNLMCATGCNLSSIYSLYFDEEGEIYPLLERQTAGSPLMEFVTADGIRHRVWKIADSGEIEKITALLADKKLYIADGHHRYETALNYRNHLRLCEGEGEREADYVMMTLVHMEHPGLVVFPTHRIVRGLEDFDADELVEACGEHFSLQKLSAGELTDALAAAAAKEEKAWGLCLPERAYLLRLREDGMMRDLMPGASDALRSLDVSVLHTLILERLLNIDRENMANQRNLIYTRDAAEAMEAVEQGEADCAFLINATRVEEIAAVAGAGEKMPQKSTYFYPKLITGHLMARVHKDETKPD